MYILDGYNKEIDNKKLSDDVSWGNTLLLC